MGVSLFEQAFLKDHHGSLMSMVIDAFIELDAGGRWTRRTCYTPVGEEPTDVGSCQWYRLEPQASRSVTSGIAFLIYRDGSFTSRRP